MTAEGGVVCCQSRSRDRVQGSSMMMTDDVLSGDDDRLLATINLTSQLTSRLTVAGSHNHTTSVQLAARVAVGSLLAALCLITVIGNTLVIHAVRTDRKLQTVCTARTSHVCIVSVALCVCVCVCAIASLYTERTNCGIL